MAEIEAACTESFRQVCGVPCDEPVAKMDWVEPKWHQNCDDIHTVHLCPELHALREVWDPSDEWTLEQIAEGMDMTLYGTGCSGKNTLIKEKIYPEFLEMGHTVYMVTYTNCNTVDLSNGITLHKF